MQRLPMGRHCGPALGGDEMDLLNGAQEGMAVAGSNNTGLARILSTLLTSVGYPIRVAGEHARRFVYTLIVGDAAPAESRTILPELVIRRST